MTVCRCGTDHAPPCDYPWCTNPAVVRLDNGLWACASCAELGGVSVGMSDLFVGLTAQGECLSGFVRWADLPRQGISEAARRLFPAVP